MYLILRAKLVSELKSMLSDSLFHALSADFFRITGHYNTYLWLGLGLWLWLRDKPHLWYRRQPRYSSTIHWWDSLSHPQLTSKTHYITIQSASAPIPWQRDVTHNYDVVINTPGDVLAYQALRNDSRVCDNVDERWDFQMSSKNKKASAAVRRFPRSNPCSVLTTVCMLLVVVWSHVVFYQSSVVHPPQPTSTALPPDNVSHTSTVRTIPSHWTSMEHFNASITRQSSLNSTMAQQRLSKTAAESVRANSRISIRSNVVIRTDAESEEVEMASGTVIVDLTDNDVNQTISEVHHGSRTLIRNGAKDRGRSADWKKRRLLTPADNQSSAFSPSNSPTDTSLQR